LVDFATQNEVMSGTFLDHFLDTDLDTLCITGPALKLLLEAHSTHNHSISHLSETENSPNHPKTAEGSVWAFLKHNPDKIPIFARMKPTQKQKVVQMLQKEGASVMMVGDGANDAGALRSADAGLALLPAVSISSHSASVAETSPAASFTSRRPGISSAGVVVGQARKSGAKLVQTVVDQALDTLLSAWDLAEVYLASAKLSNDQQFALQFFKVILATVSVGYDFAERFAPGKQVPGIAPAKSLFEPAIFWSMVGQALIHLSAMRIVKNAAMRGDRADYKQLVQSTFVPLMLAQSVSQVISTYAGHPFVASMDRNALLRFGLTTSIFVILAAASGFPNFVGRVILRLFPIPNRLRVILTLVCILDLLLPYILTRGLEAWLTPERFEARMDQLPHPESPKSSPFPI
ncbi:hypothetical protein AAMO2058_000537300, partial [Amorphochlora amoebiformis]